MASLTKKLTGKMRSLFSRSKKAEQKVIPFYEFDLSCQIPNLSMIFERFFPAREGTFVEIGAFDGIKFSNTFGLAKQGWYGFLVEPDPELYLKCVQNVAAYPNVKVLNKAVSSSNSKATLHRQGPLSTLSLESHLAYKNLDWAVGESVMQSVLVECRTMDTLLTEVELQPNFDLLVVDVEGHEIEVFSAFDIYYWKPSMIIVEMPDLHPDFPQLEKPYMKLKRRIETAGYSVIYKDHINTVFVSESVVELKINS